MNPGRHAWRATQRSQPEQAFRRAWRHSRRVRLMRTAMITAIPLAVGLYAAANWLSSWSGLAKLPSVDKLVVSGSRITMEAPKLAGYTRDGRFYELTANAAAQDLRKPQVIELQQVRAKMVLRDGNMVSVTADAGVYDNKTEQVVLQENVVVATSNGTEMRLTQASVDVKKGYVLSDRPVEATFPSGRLDANKMEVVEGGKVITFGGGVTMHMRGDAGQVASAGQGR